jgi:hypothetical protein
MPAGREGFSRIQRDHVERAFREIQRETTGARGGSYVLQIGGAELPAKRVLRVAYRIANGAEIAASAFSGGVFTAKILEHLGFKVTVRAQAERHRSDT